MHDDALDLVLAIDTTGSMGTHVREVRRHLLETLSEIGRSEADVRLGAIAYKAHGDEPYLLRCLPPTRKAIRFLEFFHSPALAAGEGGGGEEALECALKAANGFGWRQHARKALVVISDRPPHGGGLDGAQTCSHGVDWRDEVEDLAAKGVATYPVQIGEQLEARRVFEFIAARTGGRFIDLQHVRDLPSSIASISHRLAGDLPAYRRRLRATGHLTPGLAQTLAA
jgi:Mg-chelatase subunit ChlD